MSLWTGLYKKYIPLVAQKTITNVLIYLSVPFLCRRKIIMQSKSKTRNTEAHSNPEQCTFLSTFRVLIDVNKYLEEMNFEIYNFEHAYNP